MSEPITVAQAIAILDAQAISPRVLVVPLAHADGMRLAESIVADRDYPPFDKSVMDGFAVRAIDVANAPCELRLVGEIAAGQSPPRALNQGEAIAIMTGAPLPLGADAVVPIEDTETITGMADSSAMSSNKTIRILRAPHPERFIASRGSDCTRNTIVLEKNTQLNSAQLAVAASVGASEVKVFAKPQAAVLSTGDELTAIDEKVGEHQIRNSNNIMLVSLLKKMGCDVVDLGSVRDEPEKIRDAIENGLSHDMLFVTGGMSMGKYDFVPKILEEIGVDLKITKLKIKPGKPFVFGTYSEKFVFGLPGNPVSGFVCVVRLAARLIERLGGASLRWIGTPLPQDLPANGPREFYQPASIDSDAVHPLAWKGSADIYTLAHANGFIVRDANAPAARRGEKIQVLLIPTF